MGENRNKSGGRSQGCDTYCTDHEKLTLLLLLVLFFFELESIKGQVSECLSLNCQLTISKGRVWDDQPDGATCYQCGLLSCHRGWVQIPGKWRVLKIVGNILGTEGHLEREDRGEIQRSCLYYSTLLNKSSSRDHIGLWELSKMFDQHAVHIMCPSIFIYVHI